MFKNIEFTLGGKAYSVKPTFDIIRQLDARKPIVAMLTSAAKGVSLIDLVEYLDVLITASGESVDKLEILHKLTGEGSSGIEYIVVEIMRAAMPSLFDGKAGKAEPLQAAKPAAAKAKKKTG